MDHNEMENQVKETNTNPGAARTQQNASRKPSSDAQKAPSAAKDGQQPVRKKKNISVVFNRSSDDRRRNNNARPSGNAQGRKNSPASQNDANGQRPRKVSRRLLESEREQREKAAALDREKAKEAARIEAEKQAAEEKETARIASERARQDAVSGQALSAAQPKAQQEEAAEEAAAKQEVQPDVRVNQGTRQDAPQAKKTQPAEKPQAAQSEPAAPEAPSAPQAGEAGTPGPAAPVKRQNILAQLQKQEDDRKKAAAARKMQQKNRTEQKNSGTGRSSDRRNQTNNRNTNGNHKDGRNTNRDTSRDNNNRTDQRTNRAPKRQDTANSGKSVVFNNDNANGAKGTARKGQDNKKQNDYKKDKRRGARLDKSEKTFSLEKQSTHKKQHKTPQHMNEAGEEIRTITIPDSLTLKELADLLKIAPNVLIKKLFLAGKMMTQNQELSFEEAEEIALEYNCIAEREEKVDLIEELLREEEENEADMVPRPPVVCVMGHVDHGKTSLLDAIRHTHHIDTEAGGITQAIGAYVVEVGDRKITFLDTPGHEAFTAMRMRGANSTDIAVLVVAADDGVMPQTVEAINHAKAAGIDLIVAINKIDKPGANIDRVKQELTEYQLIPEDWGGSTVFCNISAKTGEGIDELLDMILLSADVLELKANPNRKARGLVIESRLDKGKGVVATVLVQKGTLKIGQPVAAGESYGRVRAMLDEDGHPVKSAGPSVPVEIQGLSTVPNAGEIFVALDSEKEARAFAETFISEGRNKLLAETKSRMSLDDLYEQIQAGNMKELNIIIKADVQGSTEAIRQSLLKLSNEEVAVKIIHSGVGAINESDVVLAATSNALIIGFNVAPDASAKSTAESEGVEIKLYSVIYNAIDDVERAMKGMLDPIYEEKIIGHAQIRQIFRASGVGNIAGSYVLDGVIRRDSKVRLLRGEELVFEGELASLKRFKDDVKEAKAGFECGIVISGFDKIAEDDIIEAYTMVEVPRT